MSTSLRVLMVDDQPILLEAVRQMLEPAGDLVLATESDPARALERARAEPPDVVLLDINMEPLDGLAVLDALRADPGLTEVSVVMLSTAEEAAVKVEAFRRGANDYVVKLPAATELIARVRYHARACRAARDRESAFRALLESQMALAARNRTIEEQAARLAAMNRELVEAAITDPLTGLRNRRFLRSFLERAAPAGPSHSPERRSGGAGLRCFALFDLDHFKQINDLHGHDAGDQVLVEIARRLERELRAGDAALRWGGEEFLVVAHVGDAPAAARLAGRLLHVVGGQPVVLANGSTVRSTCSLGYALHPFAASDGAPGVEQVLGLADAAAYLSKLEGRNRAHGVLPGHDAEALAGLVARGCDATGLREAAGRAVELVVVGGP
jgi:two-component system chemotaxis family response regulator WspR